jgi:hypothetical protein
MTLTSVNPYPLKVHSNGGPDFITLINSTLTDVQPGSGVFQLNATFQNNGSAPATTGIVSISWEIKMFELELSGGVGSLNESVVNLDLNGDGDKIDFFPVTWFHNETRPMDAIVDGVHAYAINEGLFEDPWLNRTYYIDGKPKLFQLGNKTHVLYDANAEVAYFGLDAFIQHYPSPIFQLFFLFYDLNMSHNLNASDFKINEEFVEINHTITYIEHLTIQGYPPYDVKCYLIPNKAKNFDSGENITFSCIVRVNKTITADVFIIVNWSPDGNRRSAKVLGEMIGHLFVVNTTSTSSTSSTTSTTSSTSVSGSGFSILTAFTLLLVIAFLIRKRRYN